MAGESERLGHLRLDIGRSVRQARAVRSVCAILPKNTRQNPRRGVTIRRHTDVIGMMDTPAIIGTLIEEAKKAAPIVARERSWSAGFVIGR